MDPTERTSVMHEDIGPHEHEMQIIVSYEIHAVCGLCGFHDWAGESEEDYRAKYPNAEVVDWTIDEDEG